MPRARLATSGGQKPPTPRPGELRALFTRCRGPRRRRLFVGENSLIPAQTRPHCPAGIQEASQSWPGHDPAPRGTRWQVPLYRRQFILRVRPETVRQRFSRAHFPRTLTSLKPGCVSIDGMSQIRSTTLLPRKRYVTVCGILGSTNIGLAGIRNPRRSPARA